MGVAAGVIDAVETVGAVDGVGVTTGCTEGVGSRRTTAGVELGATLHAARARAVTAIRRRIGRLK
jgi:hypothetical protein